MFILNCQHCHNGTSTRVIVHCPDCTGGKPSNYGIVPIILSTAVLIKYNINFLPRYLQTKCKWLVLANNILQNKFNRHCFGRCLCMGFYKSKATS